MAGNLDFETTLSANTNTFISAFRDATNTIANLGNSADASAQNLEQMSQYGRQHIQSLNLSLAQARAELVHLSATNATPQDIANAQNRIQLLQTAISQTTTVFDAYGAHAQNAMRDAANGADGAGAQLTQLQQEVSTLVGGLDGVRSSLDENGNSATHTRQQLEQMAENATTQLNQYKRQLEQAKLEVNRLAATNASPADIEQARQRVRELETGVEQVETSLDGYRSAARIANNEAASGANRSATAFEQVNTGVNGAKFAVNALVGAMAALGVGLGINELAQAADTYTNLSARINIATKDGGDFTSAMAGVHQVALMTNSSLEATGNLFTKINDTGKEMGMTQQQALDLTKTINQAIQIGGGSAQAGEAALQQFIQALQSGVLRGDEFNSIMEQAPGLTSAMAKGLGVTTGELRKMAENGELGAERITKALQSQAGQIQATYDKFPTTIGNALQRITTSWEILIGKMDQANGASSTVAQWLVVLADNIADLDIILSDVGKGFVWVGDQLKKIDPATIEALKTALVSAYDAIKSMASSLGNGLEIAGDQINSVLGAIFEFNSGVDTAADKTNGLTKLLQALNVAFGFINDGFSGIAIAANLLSGAVYAVAGGFVHLKSKILLGDAKDAAIKEFQELIKKSDEYYQRASDGATEFKSKGIEAIKEISKTQKQKNDEVVADNTATFAELLAQSTDLNQKSKVLSEERAALDKQLNQARTDGSQSTIDAIIQKSNELEGREKEHATNKAALDKDMLASAQDYAEAAIKANGGVMDGVMQADLLTKGYIVTIDEAGKVSVLAGESSEKAAEKAKAKEEALKLAKENVKKADEEYLAYQKQAAVERAILEKQIEEAKRTGDLNALSSAQNSLSGINTKEAELAKNRELRIGELNKATSGSGQVAESSYSRASAAANQLGVDLDVSLNRVSKSFATSGTQLTELKGKLNEAGVTGQNAANVLYQSWEAWLSKAKSQAEIDAAKAKMLEFEKQGVFSTKQVELGIQAIRRANAALPNELDETGKAFERLGIKTKEQLKLAAQSAIADFNTIQKSGQATQEGLQKAYEETIRLAYASGDAKVIADANAKASSLGLRVQVDETGKASVKAMNEWTKSNDRVRDSAHGIGDGYRNAGNIAREEAKSSSEAWSEAVAAASEQFDAEMKRQSKSLSEGIYNYDSYSKADVLSQLKSKGYSDKEADKLAASIWSKAMEADRDAKAEGLTKGGNPALKLLIEQEFNNASSKGLTTQHGTNKINDLLRQMSSNNLVSTGSTSKAPAVDVNSLAPQVNTPVPSATATPTSRTVQNNISINGKTISIPVAEENQGNFNDFLSELEMLKKGM